MAFATIKLKSKNGSIKEAPVGFSWTVFFVSWLVPLFRGDWKWAIIIFIPIFLTFGLSSILFAFIYILLWIPWVQVQIGHTLAYAMSKAWDTHVSIDRVEITPLSNFKFYSPYLQWFNILIRRQNRYERSMGEDDDEVTKNMPMW